MSFLEYKKTISLGDVVIVCKGFDKMFPLTVTKGHVIQVRGGAVHHDDLVGKPYGSKVTTSNGRGWVTILHPTPELWTLTLPHRTQIIYSTDASLVTMEMCLRPGSKVIEAGTGSGSLSHCIARSIAPSGCLYTFDFHQQRVKMAEEEFCSHGLSEVVRVECRDVCKDGFGLSNVADAVFLDLPNPWEAIDSAKLALKDSGSRFCSFSPCIEQVQRTAAKLEQSGFDDIHVIECLQRTYEVKMHTLTIPNVGFAASGDELTTEAYSGHKLVHPCLSQESVWTAQPSRRGPGHTGYLTFSTLQPSHINTPHFSSATPPVLC